jgi:hypothetical protein
MDLVVACSPQDSGKNLAAEYILHGDHEFRPQRALKLSAVGTDDFAKEFGEQYLGGPENGALTAKVLVNTLTSTGQGIATDEQKSFNEKDAIKLVAGKHTLVEKLPITFRHPPLLVIDDFNVDSTANKNFARKLYTLAASAKIIVFILTINDEWATKLVKLNGGTKIVPLHGNIDNLWDMETPFTDDPYWNSLQWEVTCLQDLVRPMCVEFGLSAEQEIQTSTLPNVAKRSIRLKVLGDLLCKSKNS